MIGFDNFPPGFKLLYRLQGHTKVIRQVAWSPDGHTLVSASEDGTLRLWNSEGGKERGIIKGKNLSKVKSMTWSPDSRNLAIASGDTTVRIWNTRSGQQIRILVGHTDTVNRVAWSPNSEVLASASRDETIRLWDTTTGEEIQIYKRHTGNVYHIEWSPNGQSLASVSSYKKLNVWDISTEIVRLQAYHMQRVNSLAWSPDSSTIATACNDGNLMLWLHDKPDFVTMLEGHTDAVVACSFSSNGDWLISMALDKTVRLWQTQTWQSVALLETVNALIKTSPVLLFHPTVPFLLATLGENGRAIHIWELDYDLLLRNAPRKKSVFYTTAKVALVGDSGVGKSGLGYRIAEGKFRNTHSSHGQQFWVVEELGKTRDDGTQGEAVLWDFAGQPDYRLVHSLFLEDVDLALVLFDPSRHDTLKGVEYWLRQLWQKEQMCRAVLVGARMDVSNLTLTREEIENFCRENGISGGFIGTSAKRGDGVSELLEVIRQQIDWDSKPRTVTTETFKRIKDYVLSLKADATRHSILVTPQELRMRLDAIDPQWEFSDLEMMTAVGHLQNHGYITVLRRTSDKESILLAPDVLINLAASFVLQAQRNEKGLGALEEERVLNNNYYFPELEKLDTEERDTLLNAATELFLKRNVCFRETLDGRTFLIFPALITERPPRITDDIETVEDTSYIVSGAVENVYAALVVLLGYAPTFKRTNQWRNQAQYETTRGAICGFRQTNDLAGELELVLYYAINTPSYLRSRFQGLFEEILHGRDVEVMRYPPLQCPHCGYRQERTTVVRRIRQGREFVNCEECGDKITLPKAGERITLSREDQEMVTREQIFSQMRTTYETALVRVKSLMRNSNAPTCFISYAWGVEEHQRWVWDLAAHLSNAGLEVYLDRWDAPVGTDIMRFMSLIEDGTKMNFVLPVGTPLYRDKYENQNPKTGTAVAAEVNLINVRLTRGTESERKSILPILLDGSDRESLPPMMRNLIFADFRNEATYFVGLFDLVLRMYGISFKDSAVSDLRMKLYEEAQAFPS